MLGAGLAFNIAHATGNLILALVAGPEIGACWTGTRGRRGRRSWGLAARSKFLRTRMRAAALLCAVIVAAVAAAAVAAPAPVAGASAFLVAQQDTSGGFAEQGRAADGTLTAWAALGLVAANGSPEARGRASQFLRAQDETAATPSTSLCASSRWPRSAGHRPISSPGCAATVWSARQRDDLDRAGAEGRRRGASPVLVRELRATQSRAGGWSWSRGGQPDSNDTAAAVQALRAAGVGGAPVRRALAFLRTFQNRDGGFALTKGRESDAQSTAWAIQALLAGGERPGAAAFRYLARLRRADGSYRYSVRYQTTPVWVTAQVLPALAGRWFPL